MTSARTEEIIILLCDDDEIIFFYNAFSSSLFTGSKEITSQNKQSKKINLWESTSDIVYLNLCWTKCYSKNKALGST